MDDDGPARALVRDLLAFDRTPATVDDYEKILYHLHAHLAPGEPYDAPTTWLSDSDQTLDALRHYSRSTRGKHLSVVIELLRAAGEADLAAHYVDLRAAVTAPPKAHARPHDARSAGGATPPDRALGFSPGAPTKPYRPTRRANSAVSAADTV